MERKWMKDWENFDWEPVKEALDKKEKEGIKDMDVGITIDEFLDFMGWLLVHDKAMFSKLMLSMQLVEMGLSMEQALYVARNEELQEEILVLLENKLREMGKEV